MKKKDGHAKIVPRNSAYYLISKTSQKSLLHIFININQQALKRQYISEIKSDLLQYE